MKGNLLPLTVILFFWSLFSLMASHERVNHFGVVDGHFVIYDTCDKRYPIDYVLATKLFCPMPKEG